MPEKRQSEDRRTHDARIADSLTYDIITWRIEPGEWIRERSIAERFDVSHGPVREAFRRLQREGFVEVVPWRGARVIEIDAERARHVLETWKHLFGVVCGLAALRMPTEDHELLLQLIVGYEAVVRVTNDPVEHVRTSNRVGQFISERCGNPLLADMLFRVALHARWHYPLLRRTHADEINPQAALRSAEVFREAAEAIIAGDADIAESRARELLAIAEVPFAQAVAAHIEDRKQRPATS